MPESTMSTLQWSKLRSFLLSLLARFARQHISCLKFKSCSTGCHSTATFSPTQLQQGSNFSFKERRAVRLSIISWRDERSNGRSETTLLFGAERYRSSEQFFLWCYILLYNHPTHHYDHCPILCYHMTLVYVVWWGLRKSFFFPWLASNCKMWQNTIIIKAFQVMWVHHSLLNISNIYIYYFLELDLL